MGVTGGVAAGKSTFVHILQNFGYKTISADRLVHDLLSRPTPLARAIGKEFGPEVMGPEGGVDRSRLGEIVARSPAALRRLEEIVHPAAKEVLAKRLQGLSESGERLVFVEIPLLFEAGWDDLCDVTVAIVADDRERRRRIAARLDSAARHLDLERRQLDQQEKAGLAHHIIENSGSLEEMRQQARDLVDRLEKELNP